MENKAHGATCLGPQGVTPQKEVLVAMEPGKNAKPIIFQRVKRLLFHTFLEIDVICILHWRGMRLKARLPKTIDWKMG